jgi:hypothetical protein
MLLIAEGGGVEPPRQLRSAVFKTAAIANWLALPSFSPANSYFRLLLGSHLISVQVRLTINSKTFFRTFCLNPATFHSTDSGFEPLLPTFTAGVLPITLARYSSANPASAWGRGRTDDLLIFSQTLYQLSYPSKKRSPWHPVKGARGLIPCKFRTTLHRPPIVATKEQR